MSGMNLPLISDKILLIELKNYCFCFMVIILKINRLLTGLTSGILCWNCCQLLHDWILFPLFWTVELLHDCTFKSLQDCFSPLICRTLNFCSTCFLICVFTFYKDTLNQNDQFLLRSLDYNGVGGVFCKGMLQIDIAKLKNNPSLIL